MFLVDEISQYIGRNKHLLLNLQSIIERVSDDLNHQVWIACTAQQTLDEVVERMDTRDVNDDFGKILGRFDTRISLESNDASYITQKRVLDKNADGDRVLTDLFKKQRDAIEHQFKLSHDLYKGYTKEDEFVLAYPFVPYQFRLIADVFSAFQNLGYVITEVKNNERSILGITHFTAKKVADARAEVGYFVPFDAFFNDQFRTNLTHQGSVIISRAMDISWVKADEFAKRVLRTLFMVSNLLMDDLLRFPPTVDNLTVLLMDRLDQNKLELQNRIRAVLTRLMEASIIREESGQYFFYSEDEISVTNLIKNTNPSQPERSERFDELFRGELRVEPRYRFVNSDFKIGYDVDDMQLLRNGDIQVSTVLLETSKAEERMLSAAPTTLYLCVNEWFMADETLKRDFDWYVRSTTYFKRNSDAATGIRAATHETFRDRNKLLRERIVQRLRLQFAQTRFISQNRIINAADVTGTRPDERYRNALEKHLSSIYKNLHLAKDYATTANDLRTVVQNTQVPGPDLTPAEEYVNDMISQYNDEMTVAELVHRFEKAPFGWKDTAVLHMLVHLNRKKKREFAYNNQPRYSIKEFVEKALSSAERPKCVVRATEEIPRQLLEDCRKAFRHIFNKDLHESSDGSKLYEELKIELDAQVKRIQQDEEKYYGKYPFGINFHQFRKLLNNWGQVRDPGRLFTTLVEQKDAAHLLSDTCKTISKFANKVLREYDNIQQFVKENSTNADYLPDDERKKLDHLQQFFRRETLVPADFRIAVKTHEELRKALRQQLEGKKAAVASIYAQVFDTLEKKAASLGVTEPHVIADRNAYQLKVEKCESLSELALLESGADHFRNEQMTALVRYAAGKQSGNGSSNGSTKVNEPEPYYLSRQSLVISSEEELDAYLKTIRADLLNLIQQNKTILIR